jgi:hypothetical protein
LVIQEKSDGMNSFKTIRGGRLFLIPWIEVGRGREEFLHEILGGAWRVILSPTREASVVGEYVALGNRATSVIGSEHHVHLKR